MEVSEESLDFYGQMLGLEKERILKFCEPKVIIDKKVRVQDIRNGSGLYGFMGSELNRTIYGITSQILIKSLKDDRERGSRSNGSAGRQGSHKPLSKLLFHPKVITGDLTKLSIQPVSANELAEIVKVPQPQQKIHEEHVPRMDTYLLMSGEIKISRNIGQIAAGIRLNEYRIPYDLPYFASELNDEGELETVALEDKNNFDHTYFFRSSEKRRDNLNGSLGALASSVLNARNIEAKNLANPFGGMHE